MLSNIYSTFVKKYSIVLKWNYGLAFHCILKLINIDGKKKINILLKYLLVEPETISKILFTSYYKTNPAKSVYL